MLGIVSIFASSVAFAAPMHKNNFSEQQHALFSARPLVSTAGEFNRYPNGYIAVGGVVNLTSGTPGNMLVLAGQANVGGDVGQYVLTSAGKVNFNARAAKETILFGGNINSAPQSQMHAGGFVIGGDVNLTGKVSKDITIIGGKVNLGGHYDGNVSVVTGHLTVSPNTMINGRLDYISAGPVNISPRAKINGGANQVNPQMLGRLESKPEKGAGLWHWVLQLVQLLVVLIVLHALCRGFAGCVATKLMSKPVACLGAGLLVVIAGFVALPILLLTVVGSYLALLWSLVYVMLLLLGYLYFAQSLGLVLLGQVKWADRAKTDKKQIGFWYGALAALVGLVIVTLLAIIPVVGNWLVFVFVLFGVGALVRILCGRCQSSKSA